MINEEFEIEESTTSTYTTETEQKLVNWMLRIDQEDRLIINIPQKGLSEEMEKRIEAEKFLEELKIDFEKTEIWKFEEKASIDIDLSKGKNITKKWWKFWK